MTPAETVAALADLERALAALDAEVALLPPHERAEPALRARAHRDHVEALREAVRVREDLGRLVADCLGRPLTVEEAGRLWALDVSREHLEEQWRRA